MKMTGIFLAAAILLVTMQPAFAYLDPGTGSMLLQVLLGGVAAVVVGAKFYWHKICSFFGIKPKTEIEEDQVESDS